VVWYGGEPFKFYKLYFEQMAANGKALLIVMCGVWCVICVECVECGVVRGRTLYILQAVLQANGSQR
jgi:hypothetical protein